MNSIDESRRETKIDVLLKMSTKFVGKCMNCWPLHVFLEKYP